MNVYGMMVTRNEADRYLESCLTWLDKALDGLFIFDDQSTDETVDIAKAFDATVVVRADDCPSFLTAEGAFRERAWSAMLDTFTPSDGDWIVAVDADEFPIPRTRIRDTCKEAQRRGFESIDVRIPEIFCMNPVAKRIDGYWDTITGTRLLRYNESASQTFRWSGMASGSLPEYAYVCANYNDRFGAGPALKFLHYGYACQQDRKAKYERYSRLSEGHSTPHIASIVQPPRLEPLSLDAPNVWRGRR